MGEHKLEIRFSGEDLHDKKRKKDLLCKITKYVCALMNSGGGTLSLKFTNVTVSQKILDNILGPVEKVFRDILNTSQIIENFKIREQTNDGLTLRIQASPMVTLRYNLYLPTETQIVYIRPIESHLEVQSMLERKMFEVNQDKVPESFTGGESSGLLESQTVQLKNLRSGTTQSESTFADRVMRNDFTHYVSAFANHRGGRIYYGIKDNGEVEGEDLMEEEKDEVKGRVKDKINQMKWNRIEPQEGKHWSIKFEAVRKDQTGEIIPSKFVMIIYIAPCLGGVFTEEPESYYIEEGEVKKAEFNDWLVHFKMSRQPWPISFTPRHVSSCVSWSSAHQRDVYLQFTILLVQFRNDNRKKDFTKLRRLAEREPPILTGSAPLVVISEAVAVQYKRWQFNEAHQLLKKFSEMIEKRSQDKEFHMVKEAYLRSRIERAKGEYEKSYKMAKESLNELVKIPAEFITVWYYMHLAMLANTLGARNNDPDKFREARQWLDLASRDANALDAFPGGFADLHQKLQIYQAMTLLRSSLTGEVSDECVDPGDVDTATTTLSSVYNSVMRGNLMTIYREIQFLFGQCSIYLRRSQLSKIRVERLGYLKRALIWAKQAEKLAKKCNFKDMVSYAAKFQSTIKNFMKNNVVYKQRKLKLKCI